MRKCCSEIKKKNPPYQTDGVMGYCSKSKVHHWDWAKMLLYRWPRLMSSVCAPLMFVVSREQTASYRVRSNEDDNDTRNMVGCGYVNHKCLVAVLIIAACVCTKGSHISAASQQSVFNFFFTFAESHTHSCTCKYESTLFWLIVFMISRRHGIWERNGLWIQCFRLKRCYHIVFEDGHSWVLSIKGGVGVYDVLMVGGDWVCAAEFQMDVSRENKSPFHLCSHRLLCSMSTPPVLWSVVPLGKLAAILISSLPQSTQRLLPRRLGTIWLNEEKN